MNNLNRRLLFESKQDYHVYLGKSAVGKVDDHYHSFYHCTFLISGDLAYFQWGQMLRMKPGDVLFTPTYCNHSLYTFTESTSYFCLSFSEKIMEELVGYFPKLKRDFTNLPPIIHIESYEASQLTHLLYCLLDEQNTTAANVFHPGGMLVISALMLMIRSVYITQLLDCKQPAENNYAEVIKCIRYIEDNLNSNIEIEDLLKVAALSQSCLYKAFKHQTGVPIKRFIAERRIQLSLRMLRDGKSVTEAASVTGFQDFSTFYRNFIKYMGVSPSTAAKRLSKATSKSNPGVPSHLNACFSCLRCSEFCKMHAITLVNGYPSVDLNKCTRCGECIGICPCGCIPVDPVVLQSTASFP